MSTTDDAGTPPLSDFLMQLHQEGDAAWWRLDPGDHLNLFEEAIAEMEPVSMRVLVGQVRAAKEVIERARSFGSRAELAAAVAEAVVSAGCRTRWVVWTRDPRGRVLLFGPYASLKAAATAAGSGALASLPGTKGGVLPLGMPQSGKKGKARNG